MYLFRKNTQKKLKEKLNYENYGVSITNRFLLVLFSPIINMKSLI